MNNAPSTTQFMHIQAYQRHPRTLKRGQLSEKKWSCKDVIGEGLRLPNCHPHVEKPRAPIIHTWDSPPIESVMEFSDWIEATMGACAEESGARLRKNALALGTIIVSLSSDDDIGKLDDLHDLSVKFFKRWLAIHDITPNYSIMHLDEATPHIHIWATPAPAQYEKKKWKLSDAFSLAGRDLQLLQGLFYHEVGKPLGLSQKTSTPKGHKFDRRTLRTMQMNPLYLRYSPQYEAGFINAMDRMFRIGEFPQAFFEKIILSELDAESVNLFRERIELPEIDPHVHYQLRETEIEPAKFNSRFNLNDVFSPGDASNNYDEYSSW